jgi:hypothetical protein
MVVIAFMVDVVIAVVADEPDELETKKTATRPSTHQERKVHHSD